MGWKEWPYWLKGGIIVTIFGLIMIGLLFFQSSDNEYSLMNKLLKPVQIVGEPISDFFFFIFCDTSGDCMEGPCTVCNGVGGEISEVLTVLSILAIYFLIGALIGFILYKVKSK